MRWHAPNSVLATSSFLLLVNPTLGFWCLSIEPNMEHHKTTTTTDSSPCFGRHHNPVEIDSERSERGVSEKRGPALFSVASRRDLIGGDPESATPAVGGLCVMHATRLGVAVCSDALAMWQCVQTCSDGRCQGHVEAQPILFTTQRSLPQSFSDSVPSRRIQCRWHPN